MSEETSSFTATRSRLAGTGTSSIVSESSGVSSSLERAESVAPRAPGEVASLESGGGFRRRGTYSESRGRLCRGTRYTGTNADAKENVDGGAEMTGTAGYGVPVHSVVRNVGVCVRDRVPRARYQLRASEGMETIQSHGGGASRRVSGALGLMLRHRKL